METKVAYIADLDQDIDDVIAIEYLHKYDALAYIVCDPLPITEEGKQRLSKFTSKGITIFPEIQSGTKIVFCGGALTKVAEFIGKGEYLRALVMNGGFVGRNIIDPSEQLPKFKGKEFVKTYNFNLDIKATEKVLSSSDNSIGQIFLIGKHLCHDEKNTIKDLWATDFFYDLKEEYKFDDGKRLHDVLACHEGLALLNIIPEKTYCSYFDLSPIKNGDTWGAAQDITRYAKYDIFRKCRVAVYWK